MNISQSDIINILKTGVYPQTQKTLTYYQQKQKFPIYPFVEVIKISDSNQTDINKLTSQESFEIRFYVKYTRAEEYEESDRLETENEMLRVLENNDFIPTGVIHFEEKAWSTSLIDDEIFGSRSVLRFAIKDVLATNNIGVIGSRDKIELNSDTTPLQIQILAMSATFGLNVTKHYDDQKLAFYDPVNSVRHGEFSITYKNTSDIESVIRQLASNRNEVKGKLIIGGVTTKYLFLVGGSNVSGNYGDVQKTTTDFFSVDTW